MKKDQLPPSMYNSSELRLQRLEEVIELLEIAASVDQERRGDSNELEYEQCVYMEFRHQLDRSKLSKGKK